MKGIWTELSLSQPSELPGHIAYAKKTAGMYARMETEAETRLDQAGYQELRLKATNNYQALVDHITAWRAEEKAQLELGAH
jgi:hypothetical protein